MSVLIIANSLTSCTDTCNKKLGDTFYSVEKGSTTILSSQNLKLDFKTSTLSDLPEQYFSDIFLFDDSVLDSLYASKTNVGIIIKQADLPAINDTKNFKYQLSFGDRRTYIDCKHPGMSDTYQLDLNFDLKNNNSIYEMSNFTWEEFHSAGAL